MIRWIFIVILMLWLVALAACDGRQVGSDGYSFDHEEWNRTEYMTRNIMYDSLTELRQSAPKETHARDRELMAWSRLILDDEAPGGMICEKHFVDPAKVHAPEWVGHEEVHCIYGRWHK